jgi:LmbE family N-acetylglucosaminyl deacetylase
MPVSPEQAWLSALGELPQWDPPRLHTVVIAPHPDDETLGAGGLIATQRQRGIPVKIVAVTDGEAAYSDAAGLGEMRCTEQESALAELGVDARDIIRLRLPDSAVTSCEDALTALVRPLLASATLLIAPWLFDPHPDHEACGRAAQRLSVCEEVTLVSYVFWAWHRTKVDALTELPLRRFELDGAVQAARSAALSHHRSQLEWKTGSPILPPSLLKPAQRSFETFILTSEDPSRHA